jgi:MFS family permease
MVKRNISLINLYTVCNNMVFVLAVVVPYYKTIGLGFKEFLISEAVFSAVVLAAEIPSGYISDVWRRTTTLAVGMIFAMLGYFCLMFAGSLPETMIAQGIIGIAVAFNSGTVSALLYDTLLAEGREGEFRRLEGRRHAIGLYSTAFGCLCGALLFSLHPKLPLMADLCVLLTGLIAISFAVEPARFKKAAEVHYLRDIIDTAKYALHGHKEIAGIILISTVVFCATKLMLWSSQPYYESIGIPVAWFGAIMAGSYIIGGAAGHISHVVERFGSHRVKLAVMAGGLSLACLILWAFPSMVLAVPLFFLGTLTFGMGFPVVQSAINSQVGSERRATILSTASLMVHILFIPSSILLGFMEDVGSIQLSLLALAAQIVALGGIGFWLWKPKDQGPA